MADERQPDPQHEPATTGPDWIIPVLALAFAGYYLWSIQEMRWEAKVSGFLVAIILSVLIGAFAIRTALDLRADRVRLGFSDELPARDGLLRQGILLALILAFILGVPHAGFTLAVFGFLSVSLVAIARQRLLRALSIAAAVSFCGYLLFIVALRTDFPLGPFERLIASIAP